MGVNYKLLADNDLGGELETAFSTMKAETDLTVNALVRAKGI